jgi:hypothetical protein
MDRLSAGGAPATVPEVLTDLTDERTLDTSSYASM